MRIYTKTGDEGDTALFDGTRVSKTDPRVSAYGEVDELNAWLGLARAHAPGAAIDEVLAAVQRDLFALGAMLADPAHKIASRVEKASLTSDDVTRLEQAIDRFEADLPPLRRFILAGGCPAGAFLHLARAVCRRAERGIVELKDSGESVSAEVIRQTGEDFDPALLEDFVASLREAKVKA